ncbi:5818_t:CDS:1, partial [Scutellospora calospora]
TKNKRTIYKYEEMTKDTWIDFTEEIDKQLQKIQHNSHQNSSLTNLNKLWHKLSQAITIVAKTHIPQTK